jgi:hypothetical protein
MGAGRRLDILLVEDNADARATLKMLLGLEGHRVRTAESGAEAVLGRRVRDGQPPKRGRPPPVELDHLGEARFDLEPGPQAERDEEGRPVLGRQPAHGGRSR